MIGPGDPPGAGGRVVVELLASRKLENNPLGDPTRRRVPVYLPASYDREPDRRYPVIHVLAGFTGMGMSFLNVQAFAESFPEQLDRLMGSGSMDDVIVVMPDAFTRLGGSQYLDSPATGAYASMLVEELVPAIDARYRTLADRDHRGVVGKSSGGFGALVLAMRHPDVFGAVASHAGDMGFEYCYLPDFPRFLQALARHGSLEAFLEAIPTLAVKDGGFFTLMNVLAMAAAYSPNPDTPPLGLDLPFDLRTGALREEVWRRWLAWDPIRMVTSHVEALRSMRLLFLDAGLQDEHGLQFGARILAGRLRELDVPHVHEEFPGGHRDTGFRYDVSLPLMARALAAGRRP